MTQVEETKEDMPETGTGIRVARRVARERRWRRWRRAGFTTSMVVLVAAIPTLLYVGFDRIRNSTDGEHVTLPTDPSAPRYEANVTPTPVLLLLQTNAAKELVGATVLSLTGGTDNDAEGGSAILVPSATVVSPAAPTTLGEVFAASGADAARLAVATLLHAGIDDVIDMTPERWEQMVTPVAPLTLDNPDRLVSTTGGRSTTRFAAGQISLTAADVAPYLEARNPGESELARMVRQERFWKTWLAAVHASTADTAVPGEATAGLGRFVRALAAGTALFTQLPVSPGSDAAEQFTVDEAALAKIVASAIPFPVGAVEGDRPRVRVLDGIPSPGIAVAAAGVLVPAGAEIDVIGNADHFDYATTRIEYYEDTFLEAATRLQQALGVGEVVQVTAIRDQIDVTIVLGSDAEAAVHA